MVERRAISVAGIVQGVGDVRRYWHMKRL